MTDISEKQLSEMWRKAALGGRLATTDGQNLQVIFPGRPGDGSGPDFRQAMLAAPDGSLITGDIEVDLRSTFWRQHGHHANPRYRNVTFQVVLNSNSPRRDRPAHGPPEILEATVPGHAPAFLPPATRPCPSIARRPAPNIAAIVARAGEMRFQIKSGRFLTAMARAAPGQVFYRGLMESLGYSRNQAPFLRLASLLPLSRLSALSAKHPDLSLESLLLGSAGLMPSQMTAGAPEQSDTATGHHHGNRPHCLPIADAEEEWLRWKSRPLLSRGEWQFFKVRPSNSPPRRLSAAANLLRSQWLPDPAARLLTLIDNPFHIEDQLAVPAAGYWKSHSDFGFAATMINTLLGRGRRRDMMINIVLPFFHAWATMERWPRLRSQALESYVHYPPGADNTPLHIMAERLPGALPTPNARSQQGLLHLYKVYCRQGRCGLCPINRAPRVPTMGK